MIKRYVRPDPMEIDQCQLKPDSLTSPIDGVRDLHPTDNQPCYRFDVPDSVPNKNGAWLWITWPKGTGLAPIAQHGILDTVTWGGGGFECDIFRGQKVGAVRPFRLDGHFPRYLDDGTEMPINEATGFRLFARYRAGDARADQFAQSCVDNQINMIRASGMQDTSLYLPDPRLQYRIFPDDETYYSDLAGFLDWLGGYGLYCDFVSCMQTQTLMPDKNAQIRHLSKVWEVLTGRYGLNSKVNEQYNHDNTIEDAARLLLPPAGRTFLVSNGSKGAGDESPLLPVLDLIEYHMNDLSEWQRKGHNAWEMGNNNGAAGYVSESTRTDSDPNQVHFEDDGKTQAAMTMSAYIHTPEGKNADPFDFSLPYIAAHNRGVFAVPLEQRRGEYQRYINPDVLREYSMGTYRWQIRF